MKTQQPQARTKLNDSDQAPETAPPWDAGTQLLGLTLGDYELLDKP